MSAILVPVDPPPALAGPPAAVADRFDSLHDVRVVGPRAFGAVHWATTFVVEDGKRREERVRLSSRDTRNGQLRWVEGDTTTSLAHVLEASGIEGKGWQIVPDWAVSESGERLWCIAGSFALRTKSQWWSSGRLYEIDLRTNAITLVHAPDAERDMQLLGCRGLSDDDVLLLSTRALRWMRRGEQGWTEIASARLSDAAELAVGPVARRTIAVVRCVKPKTGATKTIFLSADGDRLEKFGEELGRVDEVRVQDGAALVRTPGGWFAVELSQGTKKKTPRVAARSHPLDEAVVEIVTAAPGELPQLVPEEIRDALSTGAPPPGRPRMMARDVAAGLDQDAVLVWRRGAIARLELPGVIRFDVSPDGQRAWTIANRAVLETSVDAPEWRAITVPGSETWGPNDVAHLDETHLVVKSDDTLHLLRREADGWKPLHRSKCPVDSTLASFPAQRCVVLTAWTTVRLYGLKGDKLSKLTEGKLPGRTSRTGTIPRAQVTSDGQLWIDGRYHVQLAR